MSDPKRAIIIIETCRKEMVEGCPKSAQYVPCIVVEGETGYYLTDWLWGNDFEVAKELADEYNAKLGLTPDDVFVLVAQSMRQEDSPYYGNLSQMVALAKEHGLDGVKFAQFWQMRFPDHGTSYMKDWARRLRDGTAKEQADHETMRALHQCGLLE